MLLFPDLAVKIKMSQSDILSKAVESDLCITCRSSSACSHFLVLCNINAEVAVSKNLYCYMFQVLGQNKTTAAYEFDNILTCQRTFFLL